MLSRPDPIPSRLVARAPKHLTHPWSAGELTSRGPVTTRNAQVLLLLEGVDVPEEG